MTKHTIDHSGFQYDVDAVIKLTDEGMKEKDALRAAHPELPGKSVAPVLAKIKKHPYYLARKEARLSILEEKGPELQQNLLDLATGARSEMVRYSATSDALDRIYGKKDDEKSETPSFVFNFSFGGAPTPPVKVDAQVVDGDQ